MTNPSGGNNGPNFGGLNPNGAGAGPVNGAYDRLRDEAIRLNQKNGVSPINTPNSKDLIRQMAPDIAKNVIDNLDRLIANRKHLNAAGADQSKIDQLNADISKLLPIVDELRKYGKDVVNAAPTGHADIGFGGNLISQADRAAANLQRADARLTPPAVPNVNPGPLAGSGLTPEDIREFGRQARLFNIARKLNIPGEDAGAPSRGAMKDARKDIRDAVRDALRDPNLTSAQKDEYVAAANSAEAKIKRALEGQKREFDEGFNKVYRFLAAAAVLQTASKVMLSDPFNYGTMPAMRVMGQTGELGSAISGAMTSKEQYNLERNQSAVGLGTGIMMMPGGILPKLLGGAIVAGGLTGKADDLWNMASGAMGGITDKDVFNRTLGEKVFNPERAIELSRSNQQATLSVNDFKSEKGASVMGMHYGDVDENGNVTSKGNTISGMDFADNILGMKNKNGYTVSRLGITSNDINRYASDFAGKSGSMGTKDMGNLLNYAMMSAPGRATTTDQQLQNLAYLRNMGIKNPEGAKNANDRFFGAVADENGKLDSFASNTLVPALIQVSQSLQLKNMSISADKMTQQVSMMYAEITKGAGKGSVYADVYGKHPEMLMQDLSSVDESLNNKLYDPGGLAFLKTMGFDPQKLALKQYSQPEELNMLGDGLMREGYMGMHIDKNDFDKKGNLMNADFSMLIGMIARTQNLPENALRMAVYESAMGRSMTQEKLDKLKGNTVNNADNNTNNFLSDVAATNLELKTQQTDALNRITIDLAPKMVRAQEVMRHFIENGTISQKAENGIDQIIKEMKNKLGGAVPAQSGGGSGGGGFQSGEIAQAAAATVGGGGTLNEGVRKALGIGTDPSRSLANTKRNAQTALGMFEKTDKATGTSFGAEFKAVQGNTFTGNVNDLIERFIKDKPELQKLYTGDLKTNPAGQRMFVNSLLSNKEGAAATVTSAEQTASTVKNALPKADAKNSSAMNEVPLVLTDAGKAALARNPISTPSGAGNIEDAFKNEGAIATAVDRAMNTLKPEIRAKLDKSTPDSSVYSTTRDSIDEQLKNPNLSPQERQSLLNRKNLVGRMEQKDNSFVKAGKTDSALDLRKILTAANINGGADGIFDLDRMFKGKDGKFYNGVGGTTRVNENKIPENYQPPAVPKTEKKKTTSSTPTVPVAADVAASRQRTNSESNSTTVTNSGKNEYIVRIRNDMPVDEMEKLIRAKTAATTIASRGSSPQALGMHI